MVSDDESGLTNNEPRKSRSKLLLLTLIALGAIVVLASATQVWIAVGLEDSLSGHADIDVTGHRANASLSPIALAVLAGAVALSIARPVFRIVLAVLVFLLGVLSGVVIAGVLLDPLPAAMSSVAEVIGLSGTLAADSISTVSLTPWIFVALGGVLLEMIAAVAVLMTGRRWRTQRGKYEIAAPAGRVAEEERSDRISDWDALTHGTDPSEGEGSPEDAPTD